jgi:hypothetical protein
MTMMMICVHNNKKTTQQVRVIKDFMARDPQELRFTLITLSPGTEEDDED